MRGLLAKLAAWLVIALIPVQGSATLIDGAWRPAHYHLHQVRHLPVAIDDGVRVMHPEDIVGYLDPEDRVQQDGIPGNAMDAAKGHLAVGPHHHAIGESGVVYVAIDDGDPTTPASAKRGLYVEWNLPSGIALLLDKQRAHARFAIVREGFPSRRSQPPLPPPRATLTV